MAKSRNDAYREIQILSSVGTRNVIVVKSITKVVGLIYVLDVFPYQLGHRQGQILVELDF